MSTSAIEAYLSTDDGQNYITSADYERRRLALANRMAEAPISIDEMSEALGLPWPVIVDLFNAYLRAVEAASSGAAIARCSPEPESCSPEPET